MNESVRFFSEVLTFTIVSICLASEILIFVPVSLLMQYFSLSSTGVVAVDYVVVGFSADTV